MRNVFLILYLTSIFILSGCSVKKIDIEPKPTIVFPLYPEEPRILYIDSYRGGLKEAKSDIGSMIDVFLGEKPSIENKASNMIKPYGTGLLNGKVYAADTGSNAVFIMDEKSRNVEFLGTDMVGRLSAPVSIAFDDKNITYVSDSVQKTIQGYDVNGKLVFKIGGRLDFTHPTGIAIDKKLNRLYVVDTKAHNYKVFDLETKDLLKIIGERGKSDGEFNYPTNIAVDRRNGNLVVCDTQNFRIQIFDKDGNFIRSFGKVGDRPGMFARPKGVAVDSEGNIYVGDSAFNLVQIFNETGELLMWFGGAGYTAGKFRLMAGIYIDDNDKIAIADGFSGRVELFQYISAKWKLNNPKRYNELKNLVPK